MMASEWLSGHLAWADPWLAPLLIWQGSSITALELVAALLSLAMVGFNLRVNPMGWPLAIVASALYAILFARFRLYGEAGLQLVFIVLSFWGWWQWLRGVDEHRQALQVRHLSPRGRWGAWLSVGLLWPVLGLGLQQGTDSDVPYWDALPTAGSLVGQWLLARKWVETWPCWLAVNLVSMSLFAYKGLWLTTLLYGLFAVLSVWGWQHWRRRVRTLQASMA